jgi:succinate dehydrogenase/fumarate reductase flavoprotein subunit
MEDALNYSFKIPPDPIPEDEIIDTIPTEVIVIGAGTSGLVCANSAAENGNKVILISASSRPVARGGSTHAINSKLTRESGVEYDIGKNFKQEIDRAGGRVDQDKWFLFARKSGEAMDWLIDKMTKAGYTPCLEIGVIDPDGIISTFPGAHCFANDKMKNVAMSQPLVVKTLAECARAAGVKIHYRTIAKQLVRDDNDGRVSAVIAENSDGRYIKYTGSRGIVLATGDFSRDRVMVSKYCPEVLPLVDTAPVDYDTQYAFGGIYAGDGHKMGLWVGAAWQRVVPNAPMVVGGAGPAPQPYGCFKGLLVNKYGLRYCNEDVSGALPGLIQLRQPDMRVTAIWDSTYAARMAPWHSQGTRYGSSGRKIEDVVAEWEAEAKAGRMSKAGSIHGLADKLDLDADVLQTTVDRYNGYCENGADEEYFKRKELLIPVKKSPFYGQTSNAPRLLVVCGGLRTNIKMQVLDKNGEVIPGLYAVGTMVGDMFANYYTYMPSGINLGATCLTFPFLVGQEIANH